jgi:hypothetical protein
MDASILLRVIASTCRCTTGCRELRMKKIQIRFQRSTPIRSIRRAPS